MNLSDYFKAYNLSEEYISDFEKFRKYLLEYNKKTNITRIEDENEFNVKHFLDSLSLFKIGLIKNDSKILDLGTGGGFPGIPLKLYNRDLDITLVDSLNKRIKFLEIVIEEFALKNIRPIHGRAEEMARDENYRESFDIVTSRAVARLSTLSEYCLPFTKVGGYFIAMKGPEAAEELKEGKRAINILGGQVEDLVEIKLPLEITHYLLIIKKTNMTDKKYPRTSGKPKNKPL